MATFDSTVRLRQLNKPELSGYILEVIGDIPNTGELVNSFYPLDSNPNSYVTSGQTGIFTTKIDLDSNYLSTLIYVGNNYYPLNNPSGYVSTLNSSILYTTGFQEIDSFKRFKIRPTVNTTGVLLIGEISGQNLGGDASGLYYETENNTLKFKSLRAGSGIEIFVDEESLRFSVTGIVGGGTDLSKSNVVYLTGVQTISGNKFFKSGLSDLNFISNNSRFSLSGNTGAKIEFYDYSYITGFSGISARRIYEDGIRVATAADLAGLVGFDIQNVVYKTGNQEIDGQKVFSDLIVNGNCEITDNEYLIPVDDSYPLIQDFGLSFFPFPNLYYNGNNTYQFSIYGVKNVNNKKVFSNPNTKTLSVVNPTNTYCIKLGWTLNNYYDEYFVAVNKDPLYSTPINDNVKYPKIGFFISKDINSIGIGESYPGGGVGKVSEAIGIITQYTPISLETYEQNISKISFESGILVLKSKSAPLVNGTGVLLNGDPNIVYTNGNQTILGKKSFSNYIQAPILKTNWIINDDSIQNLGFSSNFIGSSAGVVNNYSTVTNAYCNFIGQSAGASTSSDNSFSNFIGYWAGYGVVSSFNSNFIGNSAGKYAYGADYSNFIGYQAGSSETLNYIYDNLKSNFIGYRAGYNSNLSQNSIFIGSDAGTSSIGISNSILIGKQAGSGNVFNNPEENSFSILIGNHTSGKLNSIAIGQGAANNLERQLNIGNIIYATGLNTGIISSSNPMLGGKVGILMSNPQYTLDVSGTCRITGETIFGVKPTVNGIGVLLENQVVQAVVKDVVYATGDQVISGEKKFLEKIKIGSGSFRGVFDVDKVINDFELPIPQNATLTFPLNQSYSYNIENSNFFFYLYGYKDVQGDRVYSSPAMLEGQSPSSLGLNLYQLELSWTTNSIYDGYYIQVYNDPQLGILNGVPSSGILIQNNSTSTINIGEIQLFGPGYVTQTSSYYQSINTIGYPNLFSKKLSPELFLETGFNNRIVLNSNSIQVSGQTFFNKRPTVNGSGVLLSGEVVGNNVNIENVVYTTGTQTVVGKKTFSNVLSANVLKTNWIISEDNVQYGQLGSLSNFIGERAGVQDNSSTINNVNFIGYEAGFDIRGLNINSNLIGNSAGLSSDHIEYSNFIGYQAGLSTIDSYESNFIGYQAGSSSSQNIRSNFIGYLAGGGGESSLNYDSNYIGNQAGYYSSLCQNSNFIGYEAGAYAIGCSFSNFLGNGAGAGSVGSTSSVFIGSFAGNSTFNCFNSIFIGKSAGYQNIYTLPPYDSFSLLIGNYTSGKLNSIAIGQGAANSTEKQLNLANVIYATNINTGTIPSSIPVSNGKVGILIDNPQYTLDVSGTCRISGKAIFGERPEVNGSGVLLVGEGSQGNTSNSNILSEKYGYGAGIYTFNQSLSQGTSGNLFKIFNKSGSACQIFDVMINSSYSVAKKYSVVHQTGKVPISYLNVNSGPNGPNNDDFDVVFFNTGNSGVAMNIKNNGASSNFLATLFLGASPSGVEVKE